MGRTRQFLNKDYILADWLTSYNVVRICYHIALVLDALKISSFTLEHRFKYGSFYLIRCFIIFSLC